MMRYVNSRFYGGRKKCLFGVVEKKHQVTNDIVLIFPCQFFAHYAELVSSSNYVTKRQSLKLLGEILLDRTNFKVMTKYIESEDNLKVMMNLLRDKSKNIQFEAFHVFKVSIPFFFLTKVSF